MITTNLFVIANVKQLRSGGSFRILPPFFRTSWCVDVLNSAIFNSFHNRVEFAMILEGLRNYGGGGLNPEPPRPLGIPLFQIRLFERVFFIFTCCLVAVMLCELVLGIKKFSYQIGR